MLTSTLHLTHKARRMARDSQAIHRTIAHVLDGRGLWGSPDPGVLVVRHDRPADWLAGMPGVVAQAVTTPTDVPITGAHVEYAIIANPTSAKAAGMGKRGTVHPLPPDEWKAWLARKLDPALNLRTIDCEAMPTAVGRKPDQKVTHRRVMFTGKATVKNQTELATLMRDGVGRGKAYGCGLLLVEEA